MVKLQVLTSDSRMIVQIKHEDFIPHIYFLTLNKNIDHYLTGIKPFGGEKIPIASSEI